MTFATLAIGNTTSGKPGNGCARRAMGALRGWAAGAVLGSFLLGGAVSAAPIPFKDKQVDLTAREEPIALFMQDFFGGMDLPVSVSPSVKGTINGAFKGPADKVLNKVLRSFGLMTYYDGSVVHVYTPDEVGTRMFTVPAGSAANVVAMARNMWLTDARNTLRDNQNGSLIASGSKRFIDLVGELVASQQNQIGVAGPLGFKVYYLHYAWAQDVAVENNGKTTVVPGVASILRALLTTSQRGGQAPVLTQSQGTGEQSLRGQGLARQQSTLGAQGANPALPSAETVQQAWGGKPGEVQAGVLVAPQLLSNLNAAAAMASDARVEADARLNAVIVRDAPGRLPYYDELVRSLDVEPQALEIEATIIELNSSKARELGINWGSSNNRYAFLFGNGTSSDSALLAGGSPQSITPLGEGGFLSLVVGGRINKFAARINALQKQGVARVVTSPQIMTLSNVEAVIDTNKSFYVKVAGRQEVDLFKVSAGTTLRVTPNVFREGSEVRIKLLVQIDDGSIGSTTSSTVDTLPMVQRSTINTQALLMAGESLLIGGMAQETKGEDVAKVPLLGDIPVLGNLFKSKSSNHDRVERLFLISPRLIPARRPMSASAPLGPQRPGSAVEPPPMPAYPDESRRPLGNGSPELASPYAPKFPGGEIGGEIGREVPAKRLNSAPTFAPAPASPQRPGGAVESAPMPAYPGESRRPRGNGSPGLPSPYEPLPGGKMPVQRLTSAPVAASASVSASPQRPDGAVQVRYVARYPLPPRPASGNLYPGP